MNLRTLPVGVAGVIMGTAAAVLMGNMEVTPAILCLLFVMAAQIAANLYHRYAEHRTLPDEACEYSDSDFDNIPFSKITHEASFCFGIIAALIGLGILAFSGWWGVVIGALIVLGIIVYNNGKYPLSRTPFAPVITFIFFGPVAVISTSFLQSSNGAAHKFEWLDVGPAIYDSALAGLMAVNVLYVHNAIYKNRDSQRGRHTFVETFGINTARCMIVINSLIVVFMSAVIAKEFVMPEGWSSAMADTYFWYNMIRAIAWLLFTLWIVWRMKPDSVEGQNSLELYSSLAMLAFALLQFLFFVFFGKPDDSTTTFFATL